MKTVFQSWIENGWLEKNKTLLLGGLSFIFIVFGAGVLMYPVSATSVYHSMNSMKEQIATLDNPEITPQEVLKNIASLQHLAKTSPPLAPLFQGKVVQALIGLKQPAEAVATFQQIAKRTQKNSLFPFQAYAENTIQTLSQEILVQLSHNQALLDVLEPFDSLPQEKKMLWAFSAVRKALFLKRDQSEEGQKKFHEQIVFFKQEIGDTTPRGLALQAVFDAFSVQKIQFFDHLSVQ